MNQQIKDMIIIISMPLSFVGYVLFVFYLFGSILKTVNKIISQIHNQQILLISSFLPYMFFGLGLVSIMVLYINLLEDEIPKRVRA